MDSVELQLDFDTVGLTMVVPWSLPEDLQDTSSESRIKVKQVFQNEVMKRFKHDHIFDPEWSVYSLLS